MSASVLPPKVLAFLKGTVATHPEQHEVVGPLAVRLLEAGWSLDQMIFGKKEYLVPKSPSEASKREKGRKFDGFPVDIAVFDAPEHTGDYRHLVFLVETKQPGEATGLQQLDILMGREPHVRLGVWANNPDPSAKAVFLFRDDKGKVHPQKKTVSALPTPGSKIDKDYQALTGNDLIIPSADTLRSVFLDMLDRIVARDSNVTRREEQLDQLCNVILLKLDSDKQAKLSPRKEVTFRAGASEKQTATAMRDRFKSFVDTYPDIFVEVRDRELRFSDATLADCMEDLAPLNMLGVGPEAVSIAFQVLRSAALKQEEGQYFTPQPVIAAATQFMDISYEDRIIDLACGTGGFLVGAMVAMQEKVAAEGGDQAEVVRWAQRALHGIDKDSIAVKLTKAVMQILGDGSAHCARGDSVATHRWAAEYTHLATAFKDGTFSIVFTNPPFGAPLKIKGSEARAAKLSIADQFGEKDLELGLAMLNRCHQLLREGGRLCIVLPETYYFSPSYRPVRDWTRQRFAPEAVINVPMEAFAGFCRAKTNVYVFRKLREFVEIKDAEEQAALRASARADRAESTVLMLNPRTCGIYKNGLTRYKVDKATGQRSRVVDNEMLDQVRQWRGRAVGSNEPMPPGAVLVPIELADAKDVLVPAYYDPRYDGAFVALKARLGCDETTLGKLMDLGWVDIEGGHGSPGNDQRVGTVPYVKVSDIRSMRVNVNPTNMIPAPLAERMWGGFSSGLRAWDLITPNRASSNIGEFAVLLPGEERIVLTKEVFRVRVTEAGAENLDPFYLLWAFSLRAVRDQWRRIALMQTNREDVGNRHREIRLPLPPNKDWADDRAKDFKAYFTGIAERKAAFLDAVRNGQDEFIVSISTEGPVAPLDEAESDEDDAASIAEALMVNPDARIEVAVELVARRHRRGTKEPPQMPE